MRKDLTKEQTDKLFDAYLVLGRFFDNQDILNVAFKDRLETLKEEMKRLTSHFAHQVWALKKNDLLTMERLDATLDQSIDSIFRDAGRDL
jgi:hypothetical protein